MSFFPKRLRGLLVFFAAWLAIERNPRNPDQRRV